MEIKFRRVSAPGFSKLSFQIEEGIILGVTGENYSEFLKVINAFLPLEGSAKYDNIIISQESLENIHKKIYLVEKAFPRLDYVRTVEEYLMFFLQREKIALNNPMKKILSAFKMVGLSDSDLKKELVVLSSSEQKLLQLVMALLKNPEVILLDDPFVSFDIHTQNKLKRLFGKLKERYHKTIVIASLDSNLLYELTDEMFFLKNGAVFRKGKTMEQYQKVPYLLHYHYEVPNLVLFTYLGENLKRMKLSYHKDIRDLIKDIYKHV